MEASDNGLLERLKIASPCQARWDQMAGDDTKRFCSLCAKFVYDLSQLSRAEGEALVRGSESTCVRMARRADGTVITNDCPVGAKRKHKRQRNAALLGGGLLAASALLWKSRAQATEMPHLHAGVGEELLATAASSAGRVAQAQRPVVLPEPRPMMMGAVQPMPPESQSPHMLMGDVGSVD